MKLFAFTDLHANLPVLKKIVERVNKPDIDVVICCGDISYFGMGLDECFKLLGLINKTVLMIPGNHETDEDINPFCEQYRNCININHKKYLHEDCLFVGYGDGGFSQADPKLKLLSKKFKTFFAEHDKEKVLVLHGPPYGTECDNKSAWYPDHRHNGCKVARKLIEDVQPNLVLCGHIHECEGDMDKIGETLVLNPSHKGKVITLK